MVNTIRIGMAGLGTVGRSLVNILATKKDRLLSKYKMEFKIVAIFEYDGSLVSKDGLDPAEIVSCGNIRAHPAWQKGKKATDLIKTLDYDIHVEMTPTNVETAEPALTHFKLAFASGKHVVSSNKGPFLLCYDVVMDAATKANKMVRFEATVGSAIPVLSVGTSGINGNVVTRIEAIINGTSNYILTRMATEKIDFSTALKEAQERGYAEADPTLDIGGHDAAGKLVILANALMGLKKTIKDVKTEGIEHVNLDAIMMADREGFTIKHLGIADERGYLEVRPTLVPKNSPMGAGITGTLNAIKLVTDLANEIILSGRGAGGMEAAAAVLTDVIEIFKNKN